MSTPWTAKAETLNRDFVAAFELHDLRMIWLGGLGDLGTGLDSSFEQGVTQRIMDLLDDRSVLQGSAYADAH